MILAERFNYPPEYLERSRQALEVALATAPAYRGWRQRDPGPTADINARYDALPELTKQMIRDSFPYGLVPNGRDVQQGLENDEIQYTFTSGATGDRVTNIWDQNWWDRAEQASWQLNAHLAALPYPVRQAELASSLNVGISCEEDLPYEARIVGQKLYLNEKINLVQWLPRHYQRMAAELERWQPVVLEANPALLARLAFWALDHDLALYQPQAIIFTYEFVSVIHQAAIAAVFDAPQISSFGTTETGFVLQECEDGQLHQNLDFCRIDFYPLRPEQGGPELGRILVTTFQNPWNSVVRFDTGDLVRLADSGSCSCGRQQGLLARAVEGRVTNLTFTTAGRLVTTGELDQTLARVPGIRDYHLEQNSPNDYLVQLMVGSYSNPRQIMDESRERLQELYGDGHFELAILPNILPGPAGKFRRTQANFDYDLGGLFQ